jgi:hypothetical protein
MTFRRTSQGMNNQHLFHNVDIIVFLEGGPKTFSKEEIEDGQFHEQTVDILFWSNVFKKFKDGTKFKFKSVGSKTALREIARQVADGILTTVFVAMDREFDHLQNCLIQHASIFYTYGYSWENDVWNDVMIFEIIREVTAEEIDQVEITTEIERFLREIKIGVYADAYLFLKNSSFFKRPRGHLGCINCSPMDLPDVRRAELEAMLVSKGLNRRTILAFGRRKQIEVRQNCYGHLLADYCFQFVMHFLKNRLNLPALPKDLLNRMTIKKFFAHYFDNSEVFQHYALLFSR